MSPDNTSANNILQNALLLTEVAIDLNERYVSGEKYVCLLKTVVSAADKAISTLNFISKSSLEQAHQMLMSVPEKEASLAFRQGRDRLMIVIEKQLNDLEMHTLQAGFEIPDQAQISEKIRYLETRQKHSEGNLNTSSSNSKNLKTDVNEKYPENLSRESLIDLSTIVNLPPVPEDIFTGFSNRPIRTSSLSSLKSMRKIKMHLQKAESSDDEDSSDTEDHDYPKLIYGDSEEGKLSSPHSPVTNKKILGNIKEETQD